MSLSSDLVSQFVKVMKPEKKTDKETTVYGKTVEYNGSTYVQLDGSDLLTPVSTTADTKPGERVSVLIKNHTATVTGNVTSPAARSGDVKDLGNKITEVEILVADKVSTSQLEAEKARIDTLVSENVTIRDRLTASEADIDTIQANNVIISGKITAAEADIENLKTTKISVEIADAKYATIENLDATNVEVNNLKSTYGEFKDLATNKFTAIEADIETLDTEKLSATTADAKYATIDFSNIGKAAIEHFYATSGIIKDLVIGDTSVTGKLVGVTITGDLIEGGTVKADKLVVLGSDGLYYKLNTNGVTTTAEQTEYNSLSGSVITAKSITAEKVNVDDLVAFDATIGGFNITANAIYSGVKESATNTTRGIYLDKLGQLSVGDADDFVKYYKDQNGDYKLEISADSISIKAGGKSTDLGTALAESKILVVNLSRDNAVVLVNSLGEIDLSEASIQVSCKIGSIDRTADATYEFSPVGLVGNWDSTTHVYTISSMSATTGYVTITVTVDGQTVQKRFTVIQVKNGQNGTDGTPGKDGTDGISVVSLTAHYAASESGDTAPTDGWSETMPERDDTQYLWGYYTVAFSDGTTQDTKPYVVAGAGETYTELTSQLQTVVHDYQTKIEQTKAEILQTTSETYATAESFSKLETKVEQTAQQIEFRFTAANGRIQDVADALSSNQQLLEEYIRFKGALMELGRSDSDFIAKLSNERLSFYEGSNEIAYISNNALNITDAQIRRRLSISYINDSGEITHTYDWIVRSNGHITLARRR